MKNTITLLISALLISCASPSNKEIENVIERWLKIDVPSDFQLLQHEFSFVPGDDLTTVEVEYSEPDFRAFVELLDLSQWKKVGSGYQLSVMSPDGGHGYDFFLISISPNKNRVLRIQYGNE